jgi:hypothetical protein
MKHRIALVPALVLTLGIVVTPGAAEQGQAAAATGVDYALLIDNTGTMRQAERAPMTLAALDRFLDLLGPGDRVTVFSYGEVARPILSSYAVEIMDGSIRESVRRELSFTFDADRTDITAGVDLVWHERQRIFPRHYGGESGAVIVLLTDGKLLPVYDDYSEYDSIYRESRARLLDLARAFGHDGVPIHVIGLGSSDEIDVPHLKSIAEWSGGASYHVTAPRDLPDVYADIWETTRPEETIAEADESPTEGSLWGVRESASGGGRASRAATTAVLTSQAEVFDLASRITTGAVAVFLGVVIVGTRKRQAWTQCFSRAIGHQEQRVRGYLKPVDPPGAQTARAIIGIENPGVPTVEIGCGTEYASFATDTLIEFEGTRDGTAPTIRVIRGEVTVDGTAVADDRKLRDGEVIAFEGAMYMYLRGNRR